MTLEANVGHLRVGVVRVASTGQGAGWVAGGDGSCTQVQVFTVLAGDWSCCRVAGGRLGGNPCLKKTGRGGRSLSTLSLRCIAEQAGGGWLWRRWMLEILDRRVYEVN